MTAPTSTQQIHQLDAIDDVIEQLGRTDLRPGPIVNALFSALVAQSTLVGAQHPAIRNPARLARIQEMCARGETYLEQHWAREILTDPTRLHAFPYLSNYRLLAEAEHRALTLAASEPIQHIVFAGCGPLPLTAIELHRIAPDLRITCLDADPASVTQARAVVQTLVGPRHPISIVHADAANFDYTTADVVLIAALVGTTTEEKLTLIARVASTCRPHVLLAARSVPDDGRQLLYPRLDRADITGSLHVQDEWLPPTGVINSLMILRSETWSPCS